MKKFFAALLAVSVTAALAGCGKPAEEQLIDDITEETSVVTEAAETASETAETTVETSTATETEKTTTAVSSEAVSETKINTGGIDIIGAWIESESKEEIFVFDGKNIFIVSDDYIESYPYKFNGTTITADDEDMTVKFENEKLFIIDQDGDTAFVLERCETSDMPHAAKQQDIMGVWADTGVYGNLWFIDENSIIEFSGVTTHSNSYKFDGDKMASDNGDMSAVLFDNKLYLTDKYGTNIFEQIQPTKPSIADFEGSGYIYKNGEGLGYIDFKDGKEVVTDQTPDDYSPAQIAIKGNKVNFSLLGKTGEYTCYIKSFKQEYADKHIFLLNDSDYIVFEKLS